MPILGEIHAKPILPKAAVFAAMGYEVYSDVVKRFHESEAHIRIPTAPARSSKSFSGAAEIVHRAQPHSPLVGSLQYIVGVDYPTNKEFQYVWKWLVEERERWAVGGHHITIERAHNNPPNGNMVIVIDQGVGPYGRAKAVIEGKSSSNERSLQGEHVTQALLSEAAEHEERIWTKYLATRSTWAIFPTTPKPKAEWLQNLCEAGEKDPDLSTETFIFPYWANPLYDVEKFNREMKRAAARSETGRAEDDPYFAEQFLGRWVHYTGMVLPFSKRNHVTFDPRWLEVSQIFVSCDYGYEDACVALFWAILPSGALVIWDEIYSRHLTSAEFVTEIQAKLRGNEHRLAYVCGDPKQPQVARYMADFGLHVIDIDKKAQTDRAVGHRRLVDLLTPEGADGYPALFVDPQRCPKLVVEWKHLRYREGFKNEYGSTALVGADHAFDAGRYGVMTRPEPLREPERPDWMVEMKRQQRLNRMEASQGMSSARALAQSRNERVLYG